MTSHPFYLQKTQCVQFSGILTIKPSMVSSSTSKVFATTSWLGIAARRKSSRFTFETTPDELTPSLGQNPSPCDWKTWKSTCTRNSASKSTSIYANFYANYKRSSRLIDSFAFLLLFCSQRIETPFEAGGVRITSASDSMSLKLSRDGVKVMWDGDSYVDVTVPPRYKSQMCGLCGEFVF